MEKDREIGTHTQCPIGLVAPSLDRRGYNFPQIPDGQLMGSGWFSRHWHNQLASQMQNACYQGGLISPLCVQQSTQSLTPSLWGDDPGLSHFLQESLFLNQSMSDVSARLFG